MAEEFALQNMMIRFYIIAILFIGLVIYYTSKYGLEYSFKGNQGTIFSIIIGGFAALLLSVYKLRDQII